MIRDDQSLPPDFRWVPTPSTSMAAAYPHRPLFPHLREAQQGRADHVSSDGGRRWTANGKDRNLTRI
ncbi:hypothetical protein SAY87_029976 [Trapa incisa]|uniref:Uncharacterized protein n=1 Tax=Trapa incisa TaxID=236973 RepID=A0AAN7Q9V0_9MYRT|nr:hypothetical protein SAY87_029976 [Trapa incisa]